jgi:hypothetical protein
MPTEIVLIEQAVHTYHNQYVGDAGGIEYRTGQTFTLSRTSVITAVSFLYNVTAGSPGGNVTNRIETLSAGLPTGTLAHANLTIEYLPTASAWNKTTFASPATLSAGQYALITSCDDQANNNCWNIEIADEVYSGGGAVRKTGASWAALGAYDHTFRIYGYIIPNRNNAMLF